MINFVLNDEINNIFIFGKTGVGKTRLVKEVAMFLIMRKIFPNGVYYIDFMSVKSGGDLNDLFRSHGL